MTTHGLRRLLFICTLLFLPALACASMEETVPVEAHGEGATRDEAIAAALTQAVIKVQGQAVPAEVLADIFLKSMREERTIRMNVLSDSRIRATRISTAVAFVQDYQVQESQRLEGGKRWQARVRAEVVSPAARLAKRQETVQIALLPFQFMQEEEGEVGGVAAQAQVRQTLANITDFRRLVAQGLDHQERVAVHALPAEREAEFAAAADNPGQVKWARLSALTKADSFITVQVEDYRLEPVKLKGNITTGRLDGGFTLHYRLIKNIDGQTVIAKSDTFTIDTRHPLLRPLAMNSHAGQAPPQELATRSAAIYRRVAQLFTNALLSELLPPNVIAREGDRVMLNSGATPLRPGDRLAVLGPDVTEPDSATGLMMRQDGMRIAVLEVVSTEGGRTVARVTKGNAFGVQPGCLVRKIGIGAITAALPPSRTGAG